MLSRTLSGTMPRMARSDLYRVVVGKAVRAGRELAEDYAQGGPADPVFWMGERSNEVAPRMRPLYQRTYLSAFADRLKQLMGAQAVEHVARAESESAWLWRNR